MARQQAVAHKIIGMLERMIIADSITGISTHEQRTMGVKITIEETHTQCKLGLTSTFTAIRSLAQRTKALRLIIVGIVSPTHRTMERELTSGDEVRFKSVMDSLSSAEV